MHMGAWGAWEIHNATDGVRQTFLASIRPLSEWVICLARMGNMFFCFGFVGLGFGLLRGRTVGKWPGIAAALIGGAGVVILMVYPDSAMAFLSVGIAITLWFIALGIAVMLGVDEISES